jgi:multisubunit Na+/H+ antiporter MnhE subunit
VPVHRAVEAIIWWVVLFGVWAATLSTFPPPELVAGAAAALVCAVAAVVGRRAVDGAWRPRLRWLRWLLPLPPAVVSEAGRLLVLPFRSRVRERAVGRIQEVALTTAADATVAEAHRALATIALATTPGSFVLDSRPDDHVLVVHSLVGGRPRMDEVVRS